MSILIKGLDLPETGGIGVLIYRGRDGQGHVAHYKTAKPLGDAFQIDDDDEVSKTENE